MRPALATSLFAGAVVATCTFASPSSAESPAPRTLREITLSNVGAELPRAPEGAKVAGVSVKPQKNAQSIATISQATQACLFMVDPTGTRAWWSEPGSKDAYGTSFRADRLLTGSDKKEQRDGTEKVEIERTTFDVDSDGVIHVVGRQRVPLTEIGRGPRGVVVYGYRTPGALFVLTTAHTGARYRNSPLPPASDDVGFGLVFGSYECGFVAARLDLTKGATSAVLAGELPSPAGASAPAAPSAPVAPSAPTNGRFIINASVSKVARDPEPVVSVSIRVIEP